MNARSYEALRKLSRGRFTLSNFTQLKALAKNTVGTQSDYLLDQMNILLELYSQLDSKVMNWTLKLKSVFGESIHPVYPFPRWRALCRHDSL